MLKKKSGGRGTQGMDHRLTVEVIGGELRIRIGVRTLAFAAENPPGRGLWDDGQKIRILNTGAWAVDVRRELLSEEEDGTTEVHKLLDEAMRRACENGSAAVSLEDAAETEEAQ